MSWIKTLWLWKEVALCLLLGLSLVWGHMWWIAGVLVPAAWDSLRYPPLIKFFRPMFYSGMTAWTQRHTLWLAVPVPIGESGPAGPGVQGLFKEQDTKRSLTQVHSFSQHALGSKWHIAQIFFYSTAFSRTSLLGKQVVCPSGSKSLVLFLNLNTPTVFFLLCCGYSSTWRIQTWSPKTSEVIRQHRHFQHIMCAWNSFLIMA